MAFTIPVVLVSKRKPLCHSSGGRTRPASTCSPRSCVQQGRKAPSPRGPAPDTFEEQPAAFPVGQVCQDNLWFTLGTEQVSYSLPIVCGILGVVPASLMVQPGSLSLDLGSQSNGYTGSICHAAHAPEIGCPVDTLPFLERKELFVLSHPFIHATRRWEPPMFG